MLISRKAYLILICIIFIITTACIGCMGITEIGSPEATKLINDYHLVCQVSGCLIGSPSGFSSYSIYNTYEVIDVDWDSEFMVIKTRQPDEITLNWHIINIASEEILGPFSYEEYLLQRQNLSISEQINLLEPEKGDFEIYGQKH